MPKNAPQDEDIQVAAGSGSISATQIQKRRMMETDIQEETAENLSEQPESRLNFLDSEIKPHIEEDFIGDSFLEP